MQCQEVGDPSMGIYQKRLINDFSVKCFDSINML
jgi:hypothetical protein